MKRKQKQKHTVGSALPVETYQLALRRAAVFTRGNFSKYICSLVEKDVYGETPEPKQETNQ